MTLLNTTTHKLRVIVASIILVVWVVTLVADAVFSSYSVPPTVHGLMVMVATYLFGPTITGRGGKDEERNG